MTLELLMISILLFTHVVCLKILLLKNKFLGYLYDIRNLCFKKYQVSNDSIQIGKTLEMYYKIQQENFEFQSLQPDLVCINRVLL